MRRGAVTAVLVLGMAVLGLTARAAADPPHVTVLADSVLTAVEWNDAPLATLQRGLDVYLDVGVCRRISGVSCPYEGGRVPTLMDVINAMGVRLGPNVLVEVGYNDDLDTFAQNVDGAVQAMLHVGVQHILWVNFPATNQHWVDMDVALATVASHYGQMSIVDWNSASHEQSSWFQTDGIHLVYPGALALAGLLNQAMVQATGPPPPLLPLAAPLPAALVGRPYTTHLATGSGTAPFRWRSMSGPLPRGLRLLADGTITGVPRRPARVPIVFQVTDARAQVATLRELVVVLAQAPAADGATH